MKYRNTQINKINSQRLASIHQLDLRVDKNCFFPKWSLNWYKNIQNLYNFQAEQPDILVPTWDDTGALAPNPENPSRFSLRNIANPPDTIFSTVGNIV